MQEAPTSKQKTPCNENSRHRVDLGYFISFGGIVFKNPSNHSLEGLVS